MIFHVCNTYMPTQKAEQERLHRAGRTWQEIEMTSRGEFRGLYREADGYPRVFVEGTRRVAYVTDVINSVEDLGVESSDVVMLTNADSCLVTDVVDRVIRGVEVGGGACWSSRLDCDKPQRGGLTGDAILKRLGFTPHRGLDLVALRWDRWLELRGSYLNDVLLGYEGWDAAMILLLGEKCKIPVVCYHELHQTPYWFQNRTTSTGNLHNRRLIREWLEARGDFGKAVAMWPGVSKYERAK